MSKYNWPTSSNVPGSQGSQGTLDALLQSLIASSSAPASGPGGTVGPDNVSRGIGNATGSQFSPGSSTSQTMWAPWLDQMMQGQRVGPAWEGGDNQPWQLTLAENAKNIGRGAGALTGIPFLSVLAQALANNWMSNTALMNQADVPQSELSSNIDSMLYGDTPGQSTLGDGASRSSGGSFSAGRMVPGSGSRMNANSGFIWAMPGTYTDPRRINQRIHRNKPGG